MYGYIYRITDLTNGKCYIGQHKYDKPMLDPCYHGSGKIIKQIYKKRPNTLLEEILMICATLEELNYFETYFIEHMNTLDPFGYNLNTGGDSREGMTAWNKGKKGLKAPKTAFKKGQIPHNYIEIDIELLKKEYLENNHTIPECMKIFNCGKDVIIGRIRKYKLYKKLIHNKENKEDK